MVTQEEKNMSVVVAGSYNHDLIFNTHDLPNEGETLMGDLHEGHGGKGFNQAIACHRLGVETTFIGALGEDQFATNARSFAEAEKLACQWQIFEGLSTGLASVTTDDEGHNLIVVAPGANNAMTRGHMERSSAAFESSDVVLVQLEANLGATGRAMTLGRENRCTVIMNPAPVNSAAKVELLQRADILTPNRNEFSWMMAHLFGETIPNNWATGNDMQLHEFCRKTGVDTVIITLGQDGSFVSHDDGSRFATDITSYRVTTPAVQAVDTTGAGDSFNGALAAAISRGDRFRDALDFASKAASISTTRPGAAPSMPTAGEMASG
jgi:ribokinase